MNYEITPGGHWFEGNYKPGDVLHFVAGNYTYFSGANTSGTKENPIICTFDAGVTFSSGINLTNCSYWKFDGGVNKNLFIKDATGVALSFKGKCNGIEITGVKVDKAYSFLWFKTEVGDFNTWDYWIKNDDGTISASFIMDGLTLTNFEFLNGNFDGCYICSTGQKADRAVVIDGTTYYPLPAKVANIQIQNGLIDGAARTGMQISGLLNGINFLKNVTIRNCGKSQESYQGADFLIGGNSAGGIEIDSCIFDGSHLYNVRSSGGGVIKFTNNKCDNATFVDGKQNAEQMASVEFDTYDDTPATLFIEGNTIGASNNEVSVVVYGTIKSVNPASTFKGNTCAGDFQNFSGVEFQKSGIAVPPPPPPPPPDTTILYYQLDAVKKQATFFRKDGSNTIIDNVQRCVGAINKGLITWTVFHSDKSSQVIK